MSFLQALEPRHIVRRYRRRSQIYDEDQHEDPAWRAERIRDLVELHSPNVVESLDFIVMKSTENADVEVIIKSDRNQDGWKWETMSAGRLSAGIISRHLILPLMTFSEFTIKSPEALNSMDDTTWTKNLDVSAKTSRVTNTVHVLFRKPRVATSLRRISQITDRVKTPAPVLSAWPDVQTQLANAQSTTIGSSISGHAVKVAQPLRTFTPSPPHPHTSSQNKVALGSPMDLDALRYDQIGSITASTLQELKIVPASPSNYSKSKSKFPERVQSPSFPPVVPKSPYDEGATTEEEPVDLDPLPPPSSPSKPKSLDKGKQPVKPMHPKTDDDATEDEESDSPPMKRPIVTKATATTKRKSTDTDSDDDDDDGDGGAGPRSNKKDQGSSGVGRGWQGPRRAPARKKRF